MLKNTMSNNITQHDHAVTKEKRISQHIQQPCILWFTGYSASGKSTIANAVESLLFEKGRLTYLLDGDNIRHGLNKDLGFDDNARVENIRRIGEVSKLFVDAGLIVITAFISPFRADRQLVRELVQQHEFIEVFIDAPLDVCEQRDPKGLYKKARGGDIPLFTGIDSPYEPPIKPDIRVQTDQLNIEDCAKVIVDYLDNHKNT